MGREAAVAQQAAPAATAPSAIGLKVYVAVWLALVLVMSRDYLVLNHVLRGSTVVRALQLKGLLLAPGQKLTPDPGGPLSFRLGWAGFLTMVLTNLYVLRKRMVALQNKGNAAGWLDFHIFCGLVGPTLIVFHSNFHVSGLVAISFWSMMISFTSGIAGRYLYTQLLKQRTDLKTGLDQYEDAFQLVQKKAKRPLSEQEWHFLKERAFRYAGGSDAMTSGAAPILQVVVDSIVGDLRLVVTKPPIPETLPRGLRAALKDYGLMRRRLVAAAYYRRLMGYWHTFHMPFAVFMYVVAVIHILAAYVFRVHH